MNNKKQVLTITCHNVYNYGASLQEYALLKFLSDNGFNTQTINYTPDYLSGHFNFLAVENPKWKKNFLTKLIYVLLKAPVKLSNYPRKISFDQFHKKYIKETDQNYKNYEQLKNNPPTADYYICGSDQIWNPIFQNGKDPSFYLTFVPENKKKISYAASFATESIPNYLTNFVKTNINNLDAVSVREESGNNILRNLGITKAKTVLDPVFLLDQNQWDELIDKPLEENYILIYDFENNPLIKNIAQSLKNKFNLKIITLNKNINYADKKYYHKGPKEFLSLIKYADYVLANSFHAVAFSIIFKKIFFVFNRKIKINTRMRDLLELLDLRECMINNFENYKALSDKKINYDKVYGILDDRIKFSKEFLLNNINEKS